MPQNPPPPPPPRPARKRPYRPRRKGLHRRKHHLSARGLARLRAALRARAAWRKAHGIKLHHKFHHRKPMTPLARLHLSLALKRAAARRKAQGIHRHLSPAARAKLILRLRTMRHRGHHMSPQTRANMSSRAGKTYRIKGGATFRAPRQIRTPRVRFRIKPTRTTYRIKRGF